MPTELRDGVWWLDLGQVNAYLLEDDEELLLVDAGTPSASEQIRSAVEAVGFEVADIEHVLLTHYDVDHIGGLQALTPELSAPVYAGEPDASYLSGHEKPPLRSWKGTFQRVTGLFATRPSLEVERVEAGDSIGSFTVYETPGHTPGHVCYVSESLGVGFLGDLVREQRGELTHAPWFLSDDSSAIRASVRALAEVGLEFSIACPGHGTPLVEDGSTKLQALAWR